MSCNLVSLIIDYYNLKEDLVNLSNSLINLETKLGVKGMQFGDGIHSPVREDTTSSLMVKYLQTTIDYEQKYCRLRKLQDKIMNLYNLYKNSNNLDELIYIEKKFKHYPDAKISMLHNGIGRTSIYRKINNISNKYDLENEKNYISTKDIADKVIADLKIGKITKTDKASFVMAPKDLQNNSSITSISANPAFKKIINIDKSIDKKGEFK